MRGTVAPSINQSLRGPVGSVVGTEHGSGAPVAWGHPLRSLPVAPPDWLPLQQLFLVATVLVSLYAARRLSGVDRRPGAVLRRRFVLGVPWGTLLTMLGVLLVYWVVQGGWEHPNSPLVIPFRSWSYFYPTGILFSGFTHSGSGHITGNLLGTVVFAPLVEYVVGHYPRERGVATFSSLRTNPFVRILSVPAGSLVVGLLTGVFALGPVVGFSGVVFAYIGFAFVSRPWLAVGALVGERVVRLTYRSLRNPLITRESSTQFVSPWWADIAIQGHAFGIFLGVVLAIALLRARGERPDALSLWFGALVFGISENLWAVYAPQGASRYVLFRGVGVGLMFVFAVLVSGAVAAPDRPLLPRLNDEVSRRQTAYYLVVVVLVALAAMTVPFGFSTVDGDLPDDAERVEIRDYTVTYVENVPYQYGPSFSLFGFDVSTASAGIESSGVVVVSEKRRVWREAVPKGRLAFRGAAAVRVGGLGWRERVVASRSGWSLTGNSSAYRVSLRHDGQRRLAYRTDRVTASPTVAGRNVSIRPTERGFDVVVRRGNRTVGREPVPSPYNESRVGGLLLNRTGRSLYAIYNDTRVQVARKSVPQAQQN